MNALDDLAAQAASHAAELGLASFAAYRAAFLAACVATWAAVLSWARLGWLVAIPLATVGARASASSWAAFYAQDAAWIAAELGALVLLVLCWLLKRHIARSRYVPRARAAWRRLASAADARYVALLDGLTRKSQTLALLFPHLAYFALVVALIRLLPTLCAHSVEYMGVPALLYPLVATLGALRDRDGDAQAHWLRYWAVYGAIAAASGLCAALPFVSAALAALGRALPALGPLQLAFWAWLHLPRARSVDWAFGRLRPLLHAAAPLRARAESEWQTARAFLGYASAFWGSRSALGSALVLVRDSGAMLLALLFLPTPARITHVGCLLFGLGYPAYTAVGALVALEQQLARAADEAARAAAAAARADADGGGASGGGLASRACASLGSSLLRSADKLRRRSGAMALLGGGASFAAASPLDSGATACAARSDGALAERLAAADAPRTPHAGRSDGGGAAAGAAGVELARALVVSRLEFWCVRQGLALLLLPLQPGLEWLPLCAHAQLVAVVLLQLPYLHGAPRLFAQFIKLTRLAAADSRAGLTPSPALTLNLRREDTVTPPAGRLLELGAGGRSPSPSPAGLAATPTVAARPEGTSTPRSRRALKPAVDDDDDDEPPQRDDDDDDDDDGVGRRPSTRPRAAKLRASAPPAPSSYTRASKAGKSE